MSAERLRLVHQKILSLLLRLIHAEPLWLGSLALALYTTTLAPGVLGGDAGELQFAPAILALPHPSGYPIQTLLNRLWLAIVPFGSVAWRTNLLSAVVAALGVAVTSWAVTRSNGSRLAGLAAGAALALAPVYWSQAVLGDKYALNGLLAGLLLAAALHFYWHSGRSSLLLLAFLGGLALAHHRSLVVFAPPVAGLVLVRGRRLWRRPRIWLWTMLAFLLPLTFYLYIPWAARRGLPPTYLSHMDWPQFWNYVLVDGSSGQVQFRPDGAGLRLYGQTLQASYALMWVAVGLAGLFWRAGQQRSAQGWLLFLLGSFAISAYLAANYENYDLPRRYVYFVPSYVCLAWLLGEGVAGWYRFLLPPIWDRRRAAIAQSPEGIARGGLLVLCALIAFYPLLSLPQRWQDFWEAQRVAQPLGIWRQTLKRGGQADRLAAGLALVAPGALILGDWEQATPLWYAQQVQGYCPGCRILQDVSRLEVAAGRATEADQPLYVARTINNAADWSHPNAVGPLVWLAKEPVRSLPAGAIPLDMTFEEGVVLAGYTWPLGPPTFAPGTVLPISLIWQRTSAPVVPDYAISLRLFGPAGEVWKQDNPAPVLGMHPFSTFVPGEIVADYYEIPISADAPPGEYVLRAILYERGLDGGFRNAQARDAAGNSLGEAAEVLRFHRAAGRGSPPG